MKLRALEESGTEYAVMNRHIGGDARALQESRKGAETPSWHRVLAERKGVRDPERVPDPLCPSEKSIADGALVDCPDFTRGKWRTNKPMFALEDS
jgi:hypothetical protein